MRKLVIFLFLMQALLGSCSRLDSLIWEMDSETWLAQHPHVLLGSGNAQFVLAEPSSTVIVASLGVILLLAGILFLRDRAKSRAALYWGLALLLWGLATFLAGVSYQAFSFELKVAGRVTALWTSWWEIWYLLLFTLSVNLIVVAVAQSSADVANRKKLALYAFGNSLVYVALLLTGALLPQRFLVSFEFMLVFTGFSFLLLFILNIREWRRNHTRLDVRLMLAWVFLLLIVVLYFSYYLSGIAGLLWQKGFWFNANDVLHLGLITWILFLLVAIRPLITDRA